MGYMASHFKITPLTSRKREHLEEQRVRNMEGAFARLERALDNTTRPAWGRSTPDRLAYLQAKFDRRVSDTASRTAASIVIEEWRQRSMSGRAKPGPDRPVSEWTDGELATALSVRRYGRPTAKSDRPPAPTKPARMPRKPLQSKTSK
jgi:hypothetical protein